MLAGITSTFESHIATQGAYAVFVLMAIDAVFPAASEVVMLYAGAVAAGVFPGTHHVSLFGAKVGFGIGAFIVMALAGTLGYFVGAIIGWWIGLRGGRRLLTSRGRWLHVTPERLNRAEGWFRRWGNFGVLVGRVTPVVRSFVSIPAGIFEMRLAPYALYTVVGSAVWSFAIAGVGYGLGSSYKSFDNGFKYVEYAIVAGVLVLAAYLIYRLRKAATVRRRDDPAR
ncbi:MAG: DedA family protein [Actinomycetota bacterium]|nr:DedA family protein [Actinomycetota bacterium]